GVSAVVKDRDGDAVECRIASRYFKPLADQAAAGLIKSGKLAEGDAYRYLPSAYAQPPAVARSEGTAFSVEPLAQAISLQQRPLEEFLEHVTPYGEVVHSDVPVGIPNRVLEETTELMKQAGEAETGGVLIGELNYDPSGPEVIIQVTAQIHARYAQGELTTLTFTADTWKDVDAAIALRGRDEIKLGWWHTHPARAWCSKCPAENRMNCPRSGEFFSSQDLALHRTVFPRAYSIALVVSDSYAHGLTYPMFGWRDGLVERRGFYVLP
ncbi:MAG: hypothetical protein ACREIV_02580, partial [Planctomycetaceae bacterium]